MADVEKVIFDLIAKKPNIERTSLTRETQLSDIKLESIDMLEIIFEAEETFDISVMYNANQATSAVGADLKTAGGVVDFVTGEINRNKAAQKNPS